MILEAMDISGLRMRAKDRATMAMKKGIKMGED